MELNEDNIKKYIQEKKTDIMMNKLNAKKD